LASNVDKAVGTELVGVDEKIKPLKEDISSLEKLKDGKKDEEVPQEEKDKLEDLNKKIADLEKERGDILSGFGKDNKVVRQMIDLALLANNMLTGESLSTFVNRSIELLQEKK
ncbi:MAG: molecular chaperone HtpG, partial [Bacteroidetes bacterium]|nr:molecular chaperone HtpG [Bacteroidota bacterium]